MTFDDLPTTFFDFIKSHENEDPASLRLRLHDKELGFDVNFAITQIECRKKCRKKLAGFLLNPRFLFPNEVSSEQASNEAVARFHAGLIEDCGSLLDMTSGLGIDVITMSRSARNVASCEIDKQKAMALKWNASILSAENITVLNVDSVEWLRDNDSVFDVIFIDPARRGDQNARLYNLHDCQPDILSLLPLLRKRCDRLFIKASPLLDISQTILDFQELKSIKAISVNGECKELLVEVSRYYDNKILFEAIDLSNDSQIISRFSFHSKEGHDFIQKKGYSSIKYASSEDLKEACFIYEPNASVMKLAPWEEISVDYPSLKKLDKSSHLFISESPVSGFPGRILRIDKLLTKKDMKSIKGGRFNVVARNYPAEAQELRKKYSLKEGKEMFIYATRIGASPILISAELIKR